MLTGEKVDTTTSKPGRGGARPNSGGKRAGSGRKKGVPNKLSGDIKAMIIGALESKGGQKYLERQAEANPVAFMGLVGKVLPTTLAGDKDAPLFPNRIEIKVVGAQR